MEAVSCPNCATQLRVPPNVRLPFTAKCVCKTTFRVGGESKGGVSSASAASLYQQQQEQPKQGGQKPTTASTVRDIEDLGPLPSHAASGSATAPGPAPAPAPASAPAVSPSIISSSSSSPSLPSSFSSAPKTTVDFTVNGKAVRVKDVDPATSLNDYLRYTLGATDNKRMCGEGGCGACTVLLSSVNAGTGLVENVSINACLHPLAACDGVVVTTSKGIGNERQGYHPIQTRLAENWGTQCGSCSPGMVMAMYGLLLNNPTPSAAEVENRFDGNLCRCTGYRPILAAMKTFAVDGNSAVIPLTPAQAAVSPEKVVHEESCKGSCRFCTTGAHSGSVTTLPHLGPLTFDAEEEKSRLAKPRLRTVETRFGPQPPPAARGALPTSCKSKWQPIQGELPVRASPLELSWIGPTSLSALYSVLEGLEPGTFRLVGGNTSTGIYSYPSATTLVDITAIPELKQITVSPTAGLNIGSAVTITDLIGALEGNSSLSSTYGPLASHFLDIASHHVRNAATWVGNVMLQHNFGFGSDLYTSLMAVGAVLTIGTSTGTSQVTMDDFIGYTLPSAAVVLSMSLPIAPPGTVILCQRIAPRHQMAVSYVTSVITAVVSSSNVISSPSICFGGVCATAVRGTATEALITNGSIVSAGLLSSALTTLGGEIIPTTGPNTVYQAQVILSFFYKWWLSGQPAGTVPPPLSSAATPYERPVSIGVESYNSSPGEYPVSEAIPKIDGLEQCSGDAVFVDDIAVPFCVAGSFVTATVGCGTLVSIDPSLALACPGVIDFVSAADIPAGSVNTMAPTYYPNSIEPIFVGIGETISYNGQSIGMIIADTQAHADAAAPLVTAVYSNVGQPILTIDDAIAAKSFFPVAANGVTLGNVAKAMKEADHVISGVLQAPQQFYFFMQNHCAIAVPSEGDTWTIHVGSQDLVTTQNVVSAVLGVPAANVTVLNKRTGGAFGGKQNRSNFGTCAVAVAANKLGLPVRCDLALQTCMKMIGSRNPIQCHYSIAFNDDYTIEGIEAQFYIQPGWVPNLGAFIASRCIFTFDNVYNVPNWNLQGTVVKTNMPTNDFMRGPGMVQSIYFIENIIEAAAQAIGAPSDAFRAANFYGPNSLTPYGQPVTDFTIPTMWAQLKAGADWDNRVAAVNTYNANNTWTKQGIAIVPMKYGLGWNANKFAVQIAVCADGTVSVTHSGCEIGQGINTKVAQVCAYDLGIDMSLITIMTSTTSTNNNVTPTGGSITSEMNAQACIDACKALKDQMLPVTSTLPHNASWGQKVAACYATNINMTARGWFTCFGPTDTEYVFAYYSYGVNIVQVQVDCLTGEVQILRSDSMFDAGISMNPAIDIGQFEGAYMMGVGYWMTEEFSYNAETGAISPYYNTTWHYKPPCSLDIPIDFRVSLLKDVPNPAGVLSSKASGEPPYTLACGVVLATQKAVAAFNAAVGASAYTALPIPASPVVIQQACGVEPVMMTL